jgi:hypothetical protein
MGQQRTAVRHATEARCSFTECKPTGACRPSLRTFPTWVDLRRLVCFDDLPLVSSTSRRLVAIVGLLGPEWDVWLLAERCRRQDLRVAVFLLLASERAHAIFGRPKTLSSQRGSSVGKDGRLRIELEGKMSPLTS